MSQGLGDALRAAGIDARVETRDRLVLLVPRAGTDLTSAQRRAALALAAERGFTHVALELTD